MKINTDTIIVINMKKDTERLEKILKQFSDKNIIRIEGVIGTKLPKEILQKYENLRAGEIGCAMSHMNAWKYILDNNLDYCLIIEDDVTRTNLFEKIQNYNVPDDFDILYIGNSKSEWPRNPCSRVPSPTYSFDSENGPLKINDNIMKIITNEESPTGLYGYVVNKKCVLYLIENYKLDVPVDVFTVNNKTLKDLNVYSTVVSPLTHCYDFSSNVSKQQKETMTLKKSCHIISTNIIIILLLFAVILFFFKKMKLLHLILIFIFILSLFLVLKVDVDVEVLNYEKYYDSSTIPLEYGKKYFDPFGNVWSEENKKSLRNLFKKFVDACDKKEIPVVLFYGTLIGWARHNKEVIPWDDDMDVIIDKRYKDDIYKILSSMGDISYVDGSKNYDVKFFWKDGNPIPKHKHTWPFIDIYFYTYKNGKIVIENQKEIKCDGNIFKDLFEGVSVSVPSEYKNILDQQYGTNWYDTCISSDYNHRLEQSIDKRYINKISCKLINS